MRSYMHSTIYAVVRLCPSITIRFGDKTAKHVVNILHHQIGGTENAGLENAGQNLQVWKTQDWKTREHYLYG